MPVSWRARLLDALPSLTLVIGLVLLLSAFLAVDPAAGVTTSNSPYTDEGFNVVNARNFVLLGDWSTDDWNLHLVNLPFSLLEATVFRLVGVGVVQARLLPILATVLTVLVIGLGLKRALGRAGAFAAALALGSCAMVLYYGRLAYLEPLVALGLVAGVVPLVQLREGNAWKVGGLSGVAFAVAIATKPLALVSVAGIVVGVLVADRVRLPARRWAVAVVAVLLAALALWFVAIALPRLRAVGTDLRIWAPEPLPESIGNLIQRIWKYPTDTDGVIPLALPLLVGGAIGAALAFTRRPRLSETQQRLLGLAVGWFAAGVVTLMTVYYRPSRYALPLLPSLAILVGIGWTLVVDWADLRHIHGPLRRSMPAIAAGLVIAVPGVGTDAVWIATTPTTLPAIQGRVAAALPARSRLQGSEAPTFGLTSRSVLLVSRPQDNVNAGDLYARGVRWVIGRPDVPDDIPWWASLHPDAWNARRTEACFEWGGTQFCLWHVP